MDETTEKDARSAKRAYELRAMFTLNLMDGIHYNSEGNTRAALGCIDTAIAAANEAVTMLRREGDAVDAVLAADVLQAKALADAVRRAIDAGMHDAARKLAVRASNTARDAQAAVEASR